LGEIYYILFRQKWKIIACSVGGVLAAGAFFHVRRPVYESEAKLLIRYVMDSKSLSPASADSQIRSPDEGGNSIVNTEVEILQSFDLAQQVVDTVGPEKILPKSPEQGRRDAAATLVSKSLQVEVPGRSSVIRVVFRHSNPDVVQPVLRELIEKYLRKHVDIHQAVGVFDDFLTRQTEDLRKQLARTEQELQQARSRAGVLSLTDTKKVYTDQISKIRQEMFDAQAELAEHQAILKDLTRPAPALLNPAPSNTAVVSAEMPVGTAAAYKSVCGRLDLLWKKRQELLTQFTEENALVKEVRDQIADAETIKKKLEEENPRLTSLQSPPLTLAGQPSGPVVDASTELARVTALASKIQVLNSQLDQLRTEAVNANASEGAIQELQRKKELEEANYLHFSASLEQSRIDEAVGEGKVSNISVIQAPSPPAKAKSKTFKLMALLVVAGVYAGFTLAFVTERKLDTSVRRPIDIVTKLQLPLFLSIPRVSMNGHRRPGGAGQGEPLLLKGQEAAAPAAVSDESSEPSHGSEVAPWNGTPALHHFYEALRDRLIVDFEVRNLTHKPKLLAVTSCGRGAGVTTVASGLAACLSQTGDGNVLLVDMTQEKEAAQQF
jgi:uncharacterized protein involved in exopolysaccharide biosynthesis